jgi:uncharacterized protein
MSESAYRDSVTRFFVGAFVATWALQLPAVLVKLAGGPAEGYLPLAMLGVLCPAAIATWMSYLAGGWPAVRRLYAPLLHWRVHCQWYFIAVALRGLLLTAALLLLRPAGWDGPVTFFPPVERVIAAVVISLGEEIGWRGYALPRLQQRYGAIGASGILGALWTLWHIPMFVGLGVPLSLLPLMLVYFVGGSLVMTWIYNRTGGSLLLMVLAHVGAHLNNSHAALPEHVLPLVVQAILSVWIGYLALALPLRRRQPKWRASPHV